MERLKQQLQFLLELDKQKEIGRQTYLADGSRKEGDAEHAWHMAIMAFLLADYANEKIDVLKTIKMILMHDVVEIDAGDTYAYDTEGNKTKKLREEKAADRIYGMLPEDQRNECRALWEEFEAMETPEAKFAHAMDNLQPLILNDSNDGGDWKEHGVTAEQVYGRQRKTRLGSEKLFEEVTDHIIRKHIEKGNLKER